MPHHAMAGERPARSGVRWEDSLWAQLRGFTAEQAQSLQRALWLHENQVPPVLGRGMGSTAWNRQLWIDLSIFISTQEYSFGVRSSS